MAERPPQPVVPQPGTPGPSGLGGQQQPLQPQPQNAMPNPAQQQSAMMMPAPFIYPPWMFPGSQQAAPDYLAVMQQMMQQQQHQQQQYLAAGIQQSIVSTTPPTPSLASIVATSPAPAPAPPVHSSDAPSSRSTTTSSEGDNFPHLSSSSKRRPSRERRSRSSSRHSSRHEHEAKKRTDWQTVRRPNQNTRRNERKLSYNNNPVSFRKPGLQQVLYSDRAPPEEKLAALKPGDKMRYGDYYFYKTTVSSPTDDHSRNPEIVVMMRNRHCVDHATKESSNDIHYYGVYHPRTNYANTNEILTPNSELPEFLLHQEKIFEAPVIISNREHRAQGDECICSPTALDYHQAIFTDSICLKHNLVDQSNCHVETALEDFSFFSPNPNRCFQYSLKSRRPVLQVSLPFLQSYKWPNKPYLPACSDESPSNLKTKFFYSLFDAKSYKESRVPYLTTPENWDMSNHPFFAEPEKHDELYLHTKPLYGSESLLRTLFPQHPGRSGEIRLYILAGADFKVPTLLGATKEYEIDEVLKKALEPFWKFARGEILCPICLITISGNKIEPKCYSRMQFISHFRKIHHRNIPVVGLAFGTGYHQRLYQAMCVYFLALTCDQEEDYPALNPFKPLMRERSSKFVWSYNLRSFLQKHKYDCIRDQPVLEFVTAPVSVTTRVSQLTPSVVPTGNEPSPSMMPTASNLGPQTAPAASSSPAPKPPEVDSRPDIETVDLDSAPCSPSDVRMDDLTDVNNMLDYEDED